MAVMSFKKSGRRVALIAALAALTLPGLALADPDERGIRRHGGGEARSEGTTRGGWNQQRQQQAAQQEQPVRQERAARQEPAPQQQQAARPEPTQRGWRGQNNSGWTPPASPQGQAASAPPARSNAGWANSSQQGNGEGTRGDRNDRGSRWSGGNATTVATPAPSWRGQARGGEDRRVETRGDGRLTTTIADRRDGNRSYRDGNRDGRSNDSWRGPVRGTEVRRAESRGDYRRDNDRSGYRDGNRDGRSNDSWRNDRGHDRDHSSYRNNHQNWDNNWRRDNRYNWHSYRNHNRDIFRWGSYYSPYRNYSYRRLSIGFFMDSLFYGNRYWINDPWQYRLPDAYGPYRWVRYYDDALLVDIYSGEVVDVINNFFW
jgi:hypothetical protein